jgi:hypothetical protein
MVAVAHVTKIGLGVGVALLGKQLRAMCKAPG